MIKIIQEGKLEFPVILFNCKICGCIFEADVENYTIQKKYNQKDNEFYTSYYCGCPTCDGVAHVQRKLKI